MKPSLRFVLGLSSVFFLFHDGLRAAEQNPSAAEARRDTFAADKAPVEIRSARVTELLGRQVRNSRGDELAKIEDFLIDLENGRVVSTVLSGAAAGEGRVEVPARTFIYNKKDRVLAWSGDEQRLALAPRYSPPGSNRPAQAAHAAEVYRYYEETPYFLVESRPVRKIPGNVHTHGAVTTDLVAVPLGRVALASRLLGARINNDEGKKIGSIKDLVLDLRAGRVVVVIIGGGGFLGIGEARNAVPPAALNYYADDSDVLSFASSAEAARRAPKYDAGRFDDPGYTDEIYRAYDRKSYTEELAADNTRINRRDRDGSTLTPADQGGSTADVETTARIRKAILARDGLSVNAQNVKIITRDSHVTLRGPVKSAGEKNLIGEIAAAEAGGAAKVDNQIEVSGQ